MKKIIAFPLAFMATLALTMLPASAAEKSIKFKQAFPVGKKIHQSTVINQKMKMGGIPGAPEGQGMNLTTKITMGVSMDIEKLGMLIDAGIFKQEFDSDADDGNPFAGMAGKEMTLILDKNDQVKSVEGIEDMLGDAAAQPGIGDMLKQVFSEQQLKNMTNQGLLQNLPDKELKVGDSWDFEMETPMPQGMGAMKMSGTYTLKKFDDLDGIPGAVIGMVGNIKSKGKTKMEVQGQEIEMEIGDSKFEGDIFFDNKLGLPRKSDMLTKMKMTMGLLGQNMTMDMNMTMINKITKIEESK